MHRMIDPMLPSPLRLARRSTVRSQPEPHTAKEEQVRKNREAPYQTHRQVRPRHWGPFCTLRLQAVSIEQDSAQGVEGTSTRYRASLQGII